MIAGDELHEFDARWDRALNSVLAAHKEGRSNADAMAAEVALRRLVDAELERVRGDQMSRDTMIVWTTLGVLGALAAAGSFAATLCS